MDKQSGKSLKPYFMTAAQLEKIDKRMANTEAWLQTYAPFCKTEQAHLDEGSRERAYWHHGYLLALRDVVGLITETRLRRI